MDEVVERIDILSSARDAFPWTKFNTLLKRPEIWEPQMEDDYPPIESMDFTKFQGNKRVQIWLVMRGEASLGFVMMTARASRWKEFHAGFRRPTPGIVKKTVVKGIFQFCFDQGTEKITAMIPSFNRAACQGVCIVGMKREGVITKSFLKHGKMWDHIMYGISK